MVSSMADSREDELKRFIQQISAICMSEEFQVLRKELEAMYVRCKVENATIIAFQDALYSLLVQEDSGTQNSKSRAY
ncbi:MAG: hypothetical protein M0021_08380 [Clostridia bacterium]|nr:hypothetical protein [Clostridia bacterium]